MSYFDFNSVSAFLGWINAVTQTVASDPLTWAGLVVA
jgi:hypothetical protein